MTRVCFLSALLVATACTDGTGVGPLGSGPGGTDHPCFGNRTDTVWVDDDDSVWVGCGSTTEGYGLYRSLDLGDSWIEVAGYESWRVNHVHRATDGKLYVAGTDTDGSERVRAIVSDTEHELVFASQSQTWNSFQVGTFARTDAGLSVAESHTGADLAWRSADTEAWQDGYGWPTDSESYQVLDMVVFGDTLVGVGSTIIQAPHVFTHVAGQGFAMTPTALGSYEGELWSVDTDGVGLIAGGVDQQRNVGMVFWLNGGDPSVVADWEALDVETVSSEPTWIRGVCRNGDELVAVGEYSTRSAGLLLRSTDAGTTWTDETPDGAPSLSQCAIRGETTAVTGASGWFRRL
ncbi:MAG: hypothetical protein KC912_26720 [Proteobacteria bacterium]|nr:hypothetical protein [Pseudomonadota bacterium]